ncbi:hypothetical protein [Bacillus sp. NEAU-Y102]
MLIKIDDTVTEFIKSNKNNLNRDSLEVRALNNIATAFQQGYHVISASFETLEVLAKLDLLDHNPQRIYHKLFERFTFLPAYEDFCCSYILVKSNEFEFNKNENQHNKMIYEVPLNKFVQLSRLWPTVLLSEDYSDCQFYEKLAHKYIEENKSEINVNINLNLLSGGGVRSYAVYEGEINKGSIVLAIADNDMNHPKAKRGETIVQLEKVYKRHEKTSIIDLYELNVREKENLIPPSMYLMCCNNSSKDILIELEKIENSQEHQTKLKYIDIKDGIKVKSVKDEHYKKYFRELFEVVNLIGCSLEEIDQKNNKEVLMPGIGGKLEDFIKDVFEDGLEIKLEQKKLVAQKIDSLDDIIQKMEYDILKKKNLIDNLPDFLKDEWHTLCNKIISWGCCEHPIA